MWKKGLVLDWGGTGASREDGVETSGLMCEKTDLLLPLLYFSLLHFSSYTSTPTPLLPSSTPPAIPTSAAAAAVAAAAAAASATY